MEKTCEFCGAPQPVVYCQADAALLCLSCDAKVHSANALFGRHSRTLLCDSCKEHAVYVRCLDHMMLLCQGCESRLHKCVSQHKKLLASSFIGCPSAKHFAALWGFDVNKLEQFSTVESAASVFSTEPDIGSCSWQLKKLSSHQLEQKNSLIMHQILDLKTLQLSEGDNQTKLLRHNREYVTSSSKHGTSGMLSESLEQQSKELNCLTNELQSLDNPSQELKGERLSPSISQLDHLSSSTPVGDPFWHYKSPVDNNQVWPQNLQDLGTCQELDFFDNFNMPDVDVTFRNFEDLLTGNPDLTRALLEDNDPMSSDIEKESMNKFEKSLTETAQDAASSISTNKHVHCMKEANSPYHVTHGLSRSVEGSLHLTRYAYSATFSSSRLSAESNGSDFLDSGNSGDFTRVESANNVAKLHGIEDSIEILKDKKKTRMHGKKTQLAPRKAKADTHKRIKSQFAKVQGYESDAANATKSY